MASKARQCFTKELDVAVAAVVHEGSILVVRRPWQREREYYGRWELPGGKIEAGEDCVTAMSREVLEETGYLVKVEQVLPISYVANLTDSNPPTRVKVTCGLCVLIDPNPRPLRAEDVGRFELAWMPLNNIRLSDLIPGSREFVLWAVESHDFAVPSKGSLYRLRLESVDPASNRLRDYQMELEFDPGAESSFVVRLKNRRIGKRWHVLDERKYPSLELAVEEAMRRIEQRHKSGYSVVEMDPDHPLRSWIHSLDIPTAPPHMPSLLSLLDEEREVDQPGANRSQV